MKNPEKEKLLVFEANLSAALARYHTRTGGGDLVCVDMPFDEMLAAEADGIDGEADGIDGEPSDYEMAQRLAAAKGIFRYLMAEGPHPLKLMKRLFAIGRGLRMPFFSELTMGESALMFSETKAAHSFRMKVLSGTIKLHGMRGYRLSGQKTTGSSANYSRAQKGNQNRRKKAGKILRKKSN